MDVTKMMTDNEKPNPKIHLTSRNVFHSTDANSACSEYNPATSWSYLGHLVAMTVT